MELNERFLKRPISDIRMLKKTHWDVNSPRFKEAQLSLGYKDDEVTLKPLAFFHEE